MFRASHLVLDGLIAAQFSALARPSKNGQQKLSSVRACSTSGRSSDNDNGTILSFLTLAEGEHNTRLQFSAKA